MSETRDTAVYFSRRGLLVKINPDQVIALYRGQRGIGLAAYEKYIQDTEERSAPRKTVIMEPVTIDTDLTQATPFGTTNDAAMVREINRAIDRQLGKLGDLAGRITGFYHRKLTINDAALRRQHRNNPRLYYRDKLYALWRWNVSMRVANTLSPMGVTLAEVLALYQAEGDLNIPLSLDALYYQLEPNPLIKMNKRGKTIWYEPYGNIAKRYHGRHQTFHVQKSKEYEGLFQKEINTVIKSRSYMLNNIEKGFLYLENKSTPVRILSTGKENANQYYMSALAGLDFYMFTIIPASVNDGELRDLLTYQYARYMIKAGNETPFQQLRQQAFAIYDQICGVTPQSLRDGEVWSNAILCTILPSGIRERDQEGHYQERLQHHFFPVNPVDYVSFIILLGVIRLEAFRKDSLIFGGIRFNAEREAGGGDRYAPLPLSLAYIRYNMWDIHFAVIVLDALNKVINQMRPARSSPPYICRLHAELQSFHRSRNREVWTVLDNWFKKDNYLRSDEVTKRQAIRNAIHNDAKNGQTYSLTKPGEMEKAAIDKLNTQGKTDSMIPLLDMLTTKALWEDLRRALYSPQLLNSNLKYRHHLVMYKNRFLKDYEKFRSLEN